MRHLLLALLLAGCATAPLPEARTEKTCWNMTKEWHFKDGCNVHSAWRHQIEI